MAKPEEEFNIDGQDNNQVIGNNQGNGKPEDNSDTAGKDADLNILSQIKSNGLVNLTNVHTVANDNVNDGSMFLSADNTASGISAEIVKYLEDMVEASTENKAILDRFAVGASVIKGLTKPVIVFSGKNQSLFAYYAIIFDDTVITAAEYHATNQQLQQAAFMNVQQQNLPVAKKTPDQLFTTYLDKQAMIAVAKRLGLGSNDNVNCYRDFTVYNSSAKPDVGELVRKGINAVIALLNVDQCEPIKQLKNAHINSTITTADVIETMNEKSRADLVVTTSVVPNNNANKETDAMKSDDTNKELATVCAMVDSALVTRPQNMHSFTQQTQYAVMPEIIITNINSKDPSFKGTVTALTSINAIIANNNFLAAHPKFKGSLNHFNAAIPDAENKPSTAQHDFSKSTDTASNIRIMATLFDAKDQNGGFIKDIAIDFPIGFTQPNLMLLSRTATEGPTSPAAKKFKELVDQALGLSGSEELLKTPIFRQTIYTPAGTFDKDGVVHDLREIDFAYIFANGTEAQAARWLNSKNEGNTSFSTRVEIIQELFPTAHIKGKIARAYLNPDFFEKLNNSLKNVLGQPIVNNLVNLQANSQFVGVNFNAGGFNALATMAGQNPQGTGILDTINIPGSGF